MNPENKTKLFLIILCLSNIMLISCGTKPTWNYHKEGADWTEGCKVENQPLQSPIDITQPFEYKKMDLNFAYSNMMTEHRFGNDGNNLILEGDFGYVEMNGVTFFSSQILFFSPSQHTFAGKRLPLEMQIIHNDSKGNVLSVSILFRLTNGDYSLVLGKLGFDDDDLQRQEPFKPQTFTEQIDLSKYVSNGKDFFIYEGMEELPPCVKNTTYLILTDVLKVSKLQVDNFPKLIKDQHKKPQPRNERKIFTTFKMEDVEKKKNEVKEKVAANDKVKLEAKAIDKVQEMKDKKNAVVEHIEKINSTNSTNSTATNKTLKLTSNNTTTNSTDHVNRDQDDCVEMVPFQLVKGKAKAYDESIKKDDPKLISNAPEKNETMVIDGELPKSDIEIRRKWLETNYLLWKKLFLKTTKSDGEEKAQALIQMQVVERILTENEYEPFLKDKSVFAKHKENSIFPSIFPNFLQINSPVFRSSDPKEILLSLKTEHENLNHIVKNFMSEVEKSKNNQYKALELVQQPEEKAEDNNNPPANNNPMNTVNPNEIPDAIKQVKIFNTEGVMESDNKHLNLTAANKGPQITLEPGKNLTLQNIVDNIIEDPSVGQDFEVKVFPVIKITPLKNQETPVEINQVTADAPLNKKQIDQNQITVEDIETQMQQDQIKQKLSQYDQLKAAITNITLDSGEQLTIDNDPNKVVDLKVKVISNVNRNSLKAVSGAPQGSTNNLNNLQNTETSADVLTNSLNQKNKKLGNNIKQSQKQQTLAPQTASLDTNLDYDVKIFNNIKLTITNLLTELKQLDNINNQLYYKSNQTNFLTGGGFVRITIKNLGNLIKKALTIDSNPGLSYDSKMNQMSIQFSKEILDQNKKINIENYYVDATEINTEDVNAIVGVVLESQDTSDINVDAEKLRGLVMKILQKLPVILLKKVQNKVVNEDTALTVSDEVLITSQKKKNLRSDTPTEEVVPAGQGSKAKTKDGVEDSTQIWDTTLWPSTCKNGNQSPINIDRPYSPEEIEMKIDLKAPEGNVTLHNDGYKLILKADSMGSITHGSHRFDAKEVHIHHPSEHTFTKDEVRAPMELQIIFRDMFGNTAAMAVLFKNSTNDSEFLKAIGFGVDDPIFAVKLRNSETIPLAATEQLDLGKLINKFEHYVTYVGTLTSPPCLQDVRWFVMLQRLDISPIQLEYFPILFGQASNIRGLQPLNNRVLEII